MSLISRLVEQHTTPYAVYCATYDPAGERLLVGGGYWYGGGFLLSVEQGRQTSSFSIRGGPLAGKDLDTLAVSGLCLDATGQTLAVCAWESNHRYAPAALYRLQGEVLDLCDVYVEPELYLRRTFEVLTGGTATGVLLHEGHLVVRRTSRLYELTFSAFRLPEEVQDSPNPHLRSSRLVGVPTAVVTGFRPSSVYRVGSLVVDSDGGGCDDPSDLPNRLGDDGAILVGKLGEAGVTECRALENPHALSAADARRAHRELPERSNDSEALVTLGVREPPRGVLSAITANAAGSEIITGATSGSIAHWSSGRRPDGAMEIELRHLREGHAMPISAACHLADGQLATADRAGMVRIWDGTMLLAEWMVDGSIRTLAAHPTLGRLAVGCKAFGGGPTPGKVAIYDID